MELADAKKGSEKERIARMVRQDGGWSMSVPESLGPDGVDPDGSQAEEGWLEAASCWIVVRLCGDSMAEVETLG